MTLRFAVVSEATADFQTATELADRVFVESIDWLEDDLLNHQRTWIREWSGVPLTWKRIRATALSSGFKVRGLYDEQPAKPDARAAHRAILYLRYVIPELAGIMLIRDQDDQTDRREGLQQARQKTHGALPVVIGLAVVERECWVISGFDPKDQTEESRLEAERQKLGFDPRRAKRGTHRMQDDKALRSHVRVLRVLCGDDADRESRCWRRNRAGDVAQPRRGEWPRGVSGRGAAGTRKPDRTHSLRESGT